MRNQLLGVLLLLLAPAPAALAAPFDAPSGGTGRTEKQVVQLQELVLKDGTRAYGTVEREDENEVVFRTQAGALITVTRADIVSLTPVRGRLDGGTFMKADVHHNRLFFAPTGRALEKGQVSVGVFEFLAPFVQVGVTERFSVGGGTPLVIGIDEDYRPFWITPKFQVYNGENAQAAVGLLQMFNASGDNGGIAYGVSTFGNSDNAATFGAGLAYTDGSTGWVVMGGGERRVRHNLKLITENYMWKGGTGILSGGVRFLGERLSADLALAAPIGNDVDDFFLFPVVNFVYVFR